MTHNLCHVIAAAALAAASPVFAYAQGALQPESQREFRRIYGSSENPSVVSPATASQPAPSNALLRPESRAEFNRIFGQDFRTNVLGAVVQLQSVSTPATVNSTILTTMLASADPLKYYTLWHEISLDVTAIDHRALLDASPATYHEQFGPARAARAIALIHQAMFEAANVFDHKFTSTLSGTGSLSTAGASQDAAIVEAAYQIIAWLYPGLNDQQLNQTTDTVGDCTQSGFSLTRYYICSLDDISKSNGAQAKDTGVQVGRAIAGKIVAERSHDGSEIPEPIWGQDFVPRQVAGAANYAFTQWQPDPVSAVMTALGGDWSMVKPFAMSSSFEYRPPEDQSPAALVTKLKGNYDQLPSYNAVKTWGKEPRLDAQGTNFEVQPANMDRFFVAQFWAYDGTANLCAPIRLYNQVANAILAHLKAVPADGFPGTIDIKSITDVARFFALANLAMLDASIGAWDSKYHFQFPRPVTYIRAVDAMSTPPPGQNATTKWFPVGAQITNSDQTYNITPPFPSFPSGHATFGGALFGIMRQFMQPNAQFAFGSDEFNGKNKDAFNYIRCSGGDKLTPTKFCNTDMSKLRNFTLDCAERENAASRVFMGVHWIFDADQGIEMGNKIARGVYTTKMLPNSSDLLKQPFSVSPSIKMRSQLVCSGISYPAGWDNVDPTKGFGPLSVVPIN